MTRRMTRRVLISFEWVTYDLSKLYHIGVTSSLPHPDAVPQERLAPAYMHFTNIVHPFR